MTSKQPAPLGLEECRNKAREVLDALHPGLEFIAGREREAGNCWRFEFGIPTGNPDDPWDYLIGCSNVVFVNRRTGKVRMPDDDELQNDWMDGDA